MKWSVQVTAKADLAYLCRMVEGSGIQLTEELDGYHLRAPAFERCSDNHKVLHEAMQLVRALTGMYRLERDADPALRLGAVCRDEDDGTRSAFISISSALKLGDFFEITVIGADGEQVSSKPEPRPVRLSRLIQNCPHVCKAFRLLGDLQDHDWAGLYKIFEVIQDDVGGLITQNDWASKATISSFTGTANSPAALGDKARHGARKYGPPSRPMSYQAAEEFVRQLLIHWTDWKSQAQQGRPDEH